jgi:hypothetical protein
MSALAPEIERRPYFMYGALAVPALWIGYIAFALLLGLLFGSRSIDDLGNWGEGLVILFCLLLASEVIGLVCSTVSIVRRERFRALGFACFVLYSIPALLWAFLLALQIGANAGQRVMNEMPARNHQSHHA